MYPSALNSFSNTIVCIDTKLAKKLSESPGPTSVLTALPLNSGTPLLQKEALNKISLVVLQLGVGGLTPDVTFTFVKPSGQKEVYVNGERQRVWADTQNIERLAGWPGARLGTYYQGVIYEVLIFNTDLTTDRRQKVEGYLAHKWALAGDLPASHPYKVNPP